MRPDPTTAIDYTTKVLDHLVNDCGWPALRIHLFGFAQGGSIAAESALNWWRRGLQRQQGQKSDSTSAQPLGSVVTISGPLLSGFSSVKDVKRNGEGMPRSKDEWYPIMELWSERLGRRQLDGLYEVMKGDLQSDINVGC